MKPAPNWTVWTLAVLLGGALLLGVGEARAAPGWTQTSNARYRPSGGVERAEIFAMNADGSGLVNLTNDPATDDWSPAWSHDGARIAYTQTSPSYEPEIFSMNADGSDKR